MMPTDARANPLVLPILGLLAEGGRHAYAIFSELRSRYPYLDVRNATVYTLLRTLTDSGWVHAGPGRADRREFSLTAAGRATLATRVDHELREAELAGGSAFMTALAYLGILTPTAAAGALQGRLERIQREQARIAAALDDAGITELHMIEAHFYRDRLRHDRDWLEKTIRRIQSAALRWPATST